MKLSLIIVGVHEDIRARCLLITRLQRYQYTKLVSV